MATTLGSPSMFRRKPAPARILAPGLWIHALTWSRRCDWATSWAGISCRAMSMALPNLSRQRRKAIRIRLVFEAPGITRPFHRRERLRHARRYFADGERGRRLQNGTHEVRRQHHPAYLVPYDAWLDPDRRRRSIWKSTCWPATSSAWQRQPADQSCKPGLHRLTVLWISARRRAMCAP